MGIEEKIDALVNVSLNWELLQTFQAFEVFFGLLTIFCNQLPITTTNPIIFDRNLGRIS